MVWFPYVDHVKSLQCSWPITPSLNFKPFTWAVRGVAQFVMGSWTVRPVRAVRARAFGWNLGGSKTVAGPAKPAPAKPFVMTQPQPPGCDFASGQLDTVHAWAQWGQTSSHQLRFTMINDNDNSNHSITIDSMHSAPNGSAAQHQHQSSCHPAGPLTTLHMSAQQSWRLCNHYCETLQRLCKIVPELQQTMAKHRKPQTNQTSCPLLAVAHRIGLPG